MMSSKFLPILLRQHSYKCIVGADTRVFVVEEWVGEDLSWPARFRLRFPVSPGHKIQTIYGASSEEVAIKAADFIACGGSMKRTNKITQSSSSRQQSGPEILLLQQIQISKSD